MPEYIGNGAYGGALGGAFLGGMVGQNKAWNDAIRAQQNALGQRGFNQADATYQAAMNSMLQQLARNQGLSGMASATATIGGGPYRGFIPDVRKPKASLWKRLYRALFRWKRGYDIRASMPKNPRRPFTFWD